MELDGHQRTRAMSNGRHGASGRATDHVKSLGRSLHLIAMVHPNLQVAAVEIGE
jgi:hypothetical protein